MSDQKKGIGLSESKCQLTHNKVAFSLNIWLFDHFPLGIRQAWQQILASRELCLSLLTFNSNVDICFFEQRIFSGELSTLSGSVFSQSLFCSPPTCRDEGRCGGIVNSFLLLLHLFGRFYFSIYERMAALEQIIRNFSILCLCGVPGNFLCRLLPGTPWEEASTKTRQPRTNKVR